MGTRSRIGIMNADNTVTSVYAHWDGYWSNNGRILAESYTTEAKIRKLIKLGDLPSLKAEIGKKHKFEKSDYEEGAVEKTWTTFYMRDRGEKDCEAVTSPSFSEFGRLADDTNGEYAYLYLPAEQRWVGATIGTRTGAWLDLKEVVAADASAGEYQHSWTPKQADAWRSAKEKAIKAVNRVDLSAYYLNPDIDPKLKLTTSAATDQAQVAQAIF